ncbi:cytochrome P450 monooxygenase [Xylariaceae sp. AK1471]|nr:cytochrome P450 monooxygenase [Xylariaceae sp. AK1471]
MNVNETPAFHFGFPSLEEDWSSRAFAYPVSYVLATVLVMVVAYSWDTTHPSVKKLPYVNPPSFFSSAKAKHKFLSSAKALLQESRKLYPNQPYRMTTEYGEVVMLNSEWGDDVRNDPNLSFMGTFAQERMMEIPGFEPLATFGNEGELVQIIARKQLTKLLANITAPLSVEAALAASINMGESAEWHEVTLSPTIRDIIARMSARVFLGHELCRNKDWLHIMVNYTVDLFEAVTILQRYPVRLRRYIAWLFPACVRVRSHRTRARGVIDPVIAKREEARQAALVAGQPIPYFNDALDWIHQESKDRNCNYDVATIQLTMSVVAIQTTTDLVQQVIVDLIQHPEAMQPIRDEIANVLRADGWKKSSLYNMKLLDSVIKESQRIKPFFSGIRRSVDADTVLSDGTVVKKGSRIHIDTHRMVDPAVYQNPEEWKADRFLKLRSQSGKDHLAQLVTTSVDHLGWGHGEHACPGRFFAANEVKVALCHMLMKYDWKLAPGTDISTTYFGFNQRVNPATKVLCRKRERVELDIDSI